MKTSDLLLRCLEAEGVDTIYGVPGEENADVMISLMDSPIEFVLTRHEQGAAFMADLAGRLTGKPGVCLGTLGPGATNLITGVANANMDRSPVVALVGQAGTDRLHKESHQNMDAVSMFKPVTKWSTSVLEPENVPEIVRKGFRLACTEKPGACLIELPEDVAKRDTQARPLKGDVLTRRAGPDPWALDLALRLIQKSERPFILAGNGCVRSHTSEQLQAFVHATRIYTAHTFMGKGAVPTCHERCLFTAGLGRNDHVTQSIQKADLVICIGYDMVEWHPSIWNPKGDKRIIHIDSLPAEVDKHYHCDVEIVGDVAYALEALNERLGPEHVKHAPVFEAERLVMLRELTEFDHDEGFPMKPQRILSDLRAMMGEKDILISDVGAHKMWVARQYITYAPNTCIISNGFCSMGISMPGAIAAKRLFPKKRVVGLMGDGAFLMNVQELATAVALKVAPVFLVWEDGGYGLIELKQKNTYGKASPHVKFPTPDSVAIAEAFGCKGIRVQNAHHLRHALAEAFAETTRPTLISVPVDYRENIRLTSRIGDILAI